jgi:hypothetical protein
VPFVDVTDARNIAGDLLALWLGLLISSAN